MATLALGLEITELRLGLPGDDGVAHIAEKATKKRVFLEMNTPPDDENSTSDDGNAQAKNRVVGWPPVCSYRLKNSCLQEEEEKNGEEATAAAKTYVKVSLDGAPFLRKVGLNGYIGYADLLLAIEKLFGCFKIGCSDVKESENCEFVPIYEDKDGDWMLLGDVPWEMFIESCKRLRIMKRSEAKGFGLQSKTSGRHISNVHHLENNPPTTT